MSLMSDVTRQVKHPPTCTIHSPFTREDTKCFFLLMCANIKRHAMHKYLPGSSSSGSGVRKGYKQTAALAIWNHA